MHFQNFHKQKLRTKIYKPKFGTFRLKIEELISSFIYLRAAKTVQ